ncbi:cell division control protein 73 [Aspergillus udagawae]|uniref:Accessory factor associated with RNA polymerase II n=1 Tax=Aspergillus udagawae TaxID=91492 RepID=A0A8H3NIT6_9EURO|nr:accessory factor associated with RNA polymerase II [Aspergillus udagawae]GFF30540.1 cell division control protein 73 [Aspergillus udagawae]GFF40762.1 cell division control protein 73 [Aspergillus udagawae]GFF81037.1 cell division control protein 73 [Aspergillus udagawae]GFG04084.1 cell division control protein 73 [Aspergillus udagawae]GFG21767.1 cell division control protein 73 [Aspergillus udagawae]
MASVDPSLHDPLLALRRAIAAGSLPTPTTTSDLSDENATEDLAKATHLYFRQPIPQTIPLTAPTRFVSASSDSAVDLRSIFFAWQKKDVAIPEYITSAQELNESLKQKERKEGEPEEKVQNLVFVERLDLITWLEGASDESEYIKPLEGAAAAAPSAAPADASAAIAPGPAGAASAVPGGAQAAVAAPGGRAPKAIDPRLQEIYNGERKMGDRNSVLRGIKPTDFSHVRKVAETFLGRNRSRTGQYPPGAKPGSKPQPVVPAPSAGLTQPRKSGSSKNQDPIILLSPSASSLIRMSNVRSFLQDGVFVPPDHPTLAMPSSSNNLLYIYRPLRSEAGSTSTSRPVGASQPGATSKKPTRFILVDSTANFRPDYWNRLVAVFTTGQTWQFKSYKWTSPPELFKHAAGIYVGWRGEDVPREVRGWGRGVQSFAVERWDEKGGVHGAGRWRDREVVENIWTAIEEGMKARGWGAGSTK